MAYGHAVISLVSCIRALAPNLVHGVGREADRSRCEFCLLFLSASKPHPWRWPETKNIIHFLPFTQRFRYLFSSLLIWNKQNVAIPLLLFFHCVFFSAKGCLMLRRTNGSYPDELYIAAKTKMTSLQSSGPSLCFFSVSMYYCTLRLLLSLFFFWLLVQLFLLKNCIKEFLHGHDVVGVGTRLMAGWLQFSSWLVRIWFCIDFLGFFSLTCAFFISKCFSSIDFLGSSLAKNYPEVFYPYRFPFVLFHVAHRFEIALKCVCCLMSVDLWEASSHTMRAGTMCFFRSFDFQILFYATWWSRFPQLGVGRSSLGDQNPCPLDSFVACWACDFIFHLMAFGGGIVSHFRVYTMMCWGLTYRLGVRCRSFTFAFSCHFFVCFRISGYIWALEWEMELFSIYLVVPWIYFLRCLCVVF